MKCKKASNLISCLITLCDTKSKILLKYGSPILLLSIRILIGLVFLKSAESKLSNMDFTLYLFENEYNVPLISPIFAAYSATFFECVCSYLIMAGFATRLAALPLIAISLVIYFLTTLSAPEQLYWTAILSTLFIYGAGPLSADKIVQFIAKKCKKN